MELHNFPFDVQEIGIVISSELDGTELKLISDPHKLSFLNIDPKSLLIDQNRWLINSFFVPSCFIDYLSNSVFTFLGKSLE